MDISLEKVIENSFCISIDQKRRHIFQTVFNHYFGKVPRIFDGYTNPELDGIRKCSLSHVSIIRMAKAMELPFVTIFEDDAYPRRDANIIIRDVIRRTPEDANMLILGWNVLKNASKIDDIILKGPSRPANCDRRIYGSHAYIVFEKCYDKYIKHSCRGKLTAADDFLDRFDPTYVSRVNLFIQRCSKISMTGHVGYILDNESYKNPPNGFDKIEDIYKE